MSVPWDDCMWKEIMFTHCEDRRDPNSKLNHYLVQRMNASPRIEALPVVRVPTEGMTYDYLKSNWGLEQHRVDRLTLQVIATRPILLGELGDPVEHLLLDGCHRFAKAILLRLPVIPARIVPKALLEDFRVEALPIPTDDPELRKFLMTGYSGIP